MSIRDIFTLSKKKKNGVIVDNLREKTFPEGLMTKCPSCREIYLTKELADNLKVCPKCNHHEKMTAQERIACVLDVGTFQSMDNHLATSNPLGFPAYVEKIEVDCKNRIK